MPYMVDVLGVELRVDRADPDDVDRARRWLRETEDVSADDLRRLLETCAREASSVGIVVAAQGEAREHLLYVVANGTVEMHVAEELTGELRDRARDLAESGDLTITGTPAPPSADRVRREQLEADARAAIQARDAKRMIELLADPSLAGSEHGELRARLAKWIAERSAPEAHALLLQRLRDDVHDVAHAIMYRLRKQRGIEAAYLAELTRLADELPRTLVPFERFLKAVDDYGLDVTIPEALRRPSPPGRKRADAIDDAIGELEGGGVSLVRKAKRNLGPPLGEALQQTLRDRFAPRLTAIATRGPTTQARALAVDLLELLGVDDGALRGCVRGLPECGRVLELLHAQSELPELPLVLHSAPPPTAPVSWRDVDGAAPYDGGLWVVSPRDGIVRLLDGTTARWSTTLGVRARPLKVVRGWRKDLVFVASPWGVHALDATTGRERWVCPHVAAQLGGSVCDPRATVWDRGDTLVVQAERQLATLDRATGVVRELVETTFPLFGLRAHGDGVIALDGVSAVDDIFELAAADELAESGLVLHADGRTEDLVAPRCLAAVVREAGSARLELTRGIAVIERAGKRTLYRVPQVVCAVGPVQDGGTVPIKVRAPTEVVEGRGTWHALSLRG